MNTRSNTVVKLSPQQIRGLINEAIQGKQLGDAEPFQMTEKFGAYDADNRYHPGIDDEEPMYPHNFEATHKELFTQALQPVVDEFVESLLEIYNAGFAPEGRARAKQELQKTAEEMRQELLSVIEKWTVEGVERIV